MDRDHPSLDFVHPDRRAEVARRIAALETYLAQPGSKVATRLAGDLGLSQTQFYNLARAWRATGRPQDLAGAHVTKCRRSNMDGTQLALVEEAVRTAGHAGTDEAVRTAFSLADQRGIQLPSLKAVRRRVQRLRPREISRERIAEGAAFAVDHAVVDLPVLLDDGRVVRPLCTALLDVERGGAAALRLSTGMPTAALAAGVLLGLADVQEHGPPAIERPARIDMATADEPAWTRLVATLGKHGVETVGGRLGKYAVGAAIVDALGGAAHIRFHPRLAFAPARRGLPRFWAGSEAPLPLAEAETLLRARLGVTTVGSAPLVEPALRASLLGGLKELAGW